jgi:hypothetical protein
VFIDHDGVAPRSQTPYCVLDEDRIKPTRIERQPQRTCDNDKTKQQAREYGAKRHWTGSLRPRA